MQCCKNSSVCCNNTGLNTCTMFKVHISLFCQSELTHIKINTMQIRLLEEMKTSVTTGSRPIAAGTVMTKYFAQLQWTYFKDEQGAILIIMGWDSKDWNKVEKL